MLTPDDIAILRTEKTSRILNPKDNVGGVVVGYLGSGRFSEVHKHTDSAIKIFYADDSVDYYQNEVKVMMAIRGGPNVVNFHGCGVHQAFRPDYSPRVHPYIVMDKCDLSLSKLLKTTKLSPQAAKKISHDIVVGINHCHSNNVVHFDLKPQNVLIKYGRIEVNDDIDNNDINNITAVICDFGSSSVLPEIFTKHPGTYEYLPPEALMPFDEKLYGKAFDIWCLMCTIFETFKSERLFDLTSFLGDDSSSDDDGGDNNDDGDGDEYEQSTESSNDEEDQEMYAELLHQITCLIGQPSKSFKSNMRDYYSSKGKPKFESVSEVLPNLMTRVNDLELFGVLASGLKWNPSERITAEQLLQRI